MISYSLSLIKISVLKKSKRHVLAHFRASVSVAPVNAAKQNLENAIHCRFRDPLSWISVHFKMLKWNTFPHCWENTFQYNGVKNSSDTAQYSAKLRRNTIQYTIVQCIKKTQYKYNATENQIQRNLFYDRRPVRQSNLLDADWNGLHAIQAMAWIPCNTIEHNTCNTIQ